MKKYEARLSLENRNEKTGEWGERQTYQTEEIEDASEACLAANEIFENPDQAISDATADIFRGMTDAPDYSDTDTRWTLEIVEISDDGAEKCSLTAGNGNPNLRNGGLMIKQSYVPEPSIGGSDIVKMHKKTRKRIMKVYHVYDTICDTLDACKAKIAEHGDELVKIGDFYQIT